MNYKSILVLCDASDSSDYRIDTAQQLATKHGAHVTGLYLIPNPLIPVYGSAPYDYMGYSADEQIAGMREECEQSKVYFREHAEQLKLNYRWIEVESGNTDNVLEFIHYSDIIVSPKNYSQHSKLEHLFINGYLCTHSSKPILVIPDIKKVFSIGKRILIAWNESQEAARAIYDSLVMLRDADEVQIICVTEKDSDNELFLYGTRDLQEYLLLHGIESDAISVQKEDQSIGEVIQDAALAFDADLVVMGAYGRMRFRETILGGSSQYLLKHASIPLFLSH